MTREQAVLKLPQTEIPLIALDDWRFWVLVFVVCGTILAWRMRK